MSRRSSGKGPKLELRLHLSPPRASPPLDTDFDINSPYPTPTSSTSPPSSCLTWETGEHRSHRHHYHTNNGSQAYVSSPEATSMVLVGCPRCLMYVMLREDDPKCPRCKSTVLLDFLDDPNNINSNMRKNRKK